MKKVITGARNKVRNALGIRTRRRLLPRGPVPASGALIINGNLRMRVPDGMSPELWKWLSNLGWRKAAYKNDRRRYDDIPAVWVEALQRASVAERGEMLTSGAAAARGHYVRLPPSQMEPTGWNSPEFSHLVLHDRMA